MKQKEKKEKPKYSIRQNIAFMVRTAWHKEKSVLLICAAVVLIDLAVNLAQLYVAPEILERVERNASLPELLGTIAAFSLLLFVLNGLKRYVDANTLPGRIDVRSQIVNAINRKACVTSYPNTRDKDTLNMMEDAMNACGGNVDPTEHIWKTLTKLLTDIIGFVIYLSLLSDLSGVLISVVLAATLAGFLVRRRINEREYRHREEKAEYGKKLWYFHRKTQSVTLAKDIRIFGLGQWLEEVYQGVQKLYEAFINRRERAYLAADVTDVALAFARNGIAYVYLISMALNERLGASEFLLYFTAVSGFTSWVTGILSGFSELHRESLRISVVQEYLNLPEQFRFEGGRPIPAADGWELKLENVSFRYPGAGEEIIRGMNLTIHPGEKLAVVGLNGAGKTTIVKLLCGFYDPDEGRVLLNGTDIREFNRQEYYRLFSAVFQEFSVMDITIAETVAQTVDDIDLERVEDCVEKAGLTGYIKKLPDGLQTHVGRKVYLDGVLLSGGQTQRLMLARALYKDGPMLILDEPTAALDPIAENDIYRKYHEMTAGKTSVFISHRLASTRFCDRIIFLAKGSIVEEGTHEELMERGGGYAKLFDVQSRYYREGREF